MQPREKNNARPNSRKPNPEYKAWIQKLLDSGKARLKPLPPNTAIVMPMSRRPRWADEKSGDREK